MLIFLEGNIASGKTTLGEALFESSDFNFISEPVPEWQERFSDNMLERFYVDMPRWSFTFQICTFFTRTEALTRSNGARYTVCERSIHTDRHVFAPALHQQAAMDDLEWDLYRQFWQVMAAYVPQPDAFIYLRTPAAECLQRLQRRHRSEESGVTLEYLQQLEIRHDEWLLDRPGVLILDGLKHWTADEVERELAAFLATDEPGRPRG